MKSQSIHLILFVAPDTVELLRHFKAFKTNKVVMIQTLPSPCKNFHDNLTKKKIHNSWH